MEVVKQLAVFVQNKPGALARMCQALAKEDINLLALTVADTVDHSVVRIVVDRPDDALLLLRSSAMHVVESEVLVLELPNRPGALAEVAKRLADERINIEYAYCTTTGDQPSATLVLRTHAVAQAMAALERSQ